MPSGRDYLRGIGGAIQSGVNTAIMLKQMGAEEKKRAQENRIAQLKAETAQFTAETGRMDHDIRALAEKRAGKEWNEGLELQYKELLLEKLIKEREFANKIETTFQVTQSQEKIAEGHDDTARAGQNLSAAVAREKMTSNERIQSGINTLNKEIAELRAKTSVQTAGISALGGATRTAQGIGFVDPITSGSAVHNMEEMVRNMGISVGSMTVNNPGNAAGITPPTSGGTTGISATRNTQTQQQINAAKDAARKEATQILSKGQANLSPQEIARLRQLNQIINGSP